MHLAPLLLLTFAQTEPIDLAALAKVTSERDLTAAQKMATPQAATRLGFLRRNGVYDVGRFGWQPLLLRDVGGNRTFVVFSTRLTSEDIGEQVFEARAGKLASYLDEVNDLGVRIRHHRMSVSFDLASKGVRIDSLVSFDRLKTAGKSFLIRFSPNYRVTSVRTPSGAAVNFRQAGGVVSLPVAAAARFDYRIQYRATVDQPNYAGSITSSEANLTNDYWYPMIARRPATHETTVIVPREWTAVTQGELLETRVAGASRIFRYRMSMPVIYFSLTAAPFRQVTHTAGGKRFHVWSASMSTEDMEAQAQVNPLIIETLSEIAPYPFTSWGALISKQYGGGALEAYSYATYGEGWLPDEDPHEPAHTWFGGMINNTYLRSLWNESFATYLEGYFRREAKIGNRQERRFAFVSDADPSPAFQQETVAAGGAYAGGVASALGYGKGAMVLQALENELGTAGMLQTMREWIRTHPKGEPGEWEHYEKVVDKVTGQSYRWFFDQWLRRKGWPNLELANVQWKDGFVTGEIRQQGQPYRISLEAMLQMPDGRRTFSRVDSMPGTFRIAARERPALLSIDPWRRILRRTSPDEAAPSLEGAGPMRVYVEPGRSAWMKPLQRGRVAADPPSDPAGWILIGSPETTPLMRDLCKRVGFQVSQGQLSYAGTTIDLESGGAIALVELDEGRRCVIALGKVALRPHTGRAQLVVVDRLGRALRARTEPKTTGLLTHKF